MTSLPEPADDNHNPSQEPTPPADPSSVPPEQSQLKSQIGAPGESAAAPDEGLPEWEPLTPELVEDEAIRGDFVIRWAVVGLALLLGLSQIGDTRTLVHVRSGEYLAAHGILPPARDIFSSTASDRHWVNLSWLFDLCVAGAHGVAGGVGLTIFQGVLAGIAFGLLTHTYRPDIRTWWGSICATLTLLACYPQITVQPELITLVGLAALLWIIVKADDPAFIKILWAAVPLIWIWSQLDPRAFLGWLLVIVMALGQTFRTGDDSGARRRLWWQVAGASLAVVVIHPFLWESWLSPLRLYLVEYPALRQIFPRPIGSEVGFYSIGSRFFAETINHDSIAAFVLLAATVVSLILNRERLHPGHVLAVIVFSTLACVTTHEWAAASVVNCVVCTINAQSWYRHRFGQIYSIDWRELLFSRGGRAVTVFCLFGLAWLAISGRIDGPGGKRTGMGFDPNLLVQMEGYQQIASHTFDDRPFHFAARQGDLLIWAGQKSFIDTRAGLFGRQGESDLLALHDQTRRAIRATHEAPAADAGRHTTKRDEAGESSDPAFWRQVFTKYSLTHAMPRLSGPAPAPDYITFFDLLSNPDWVLTDLCAATAVFYYKTSEGPLAEYVRDHRLDLVKKAFQSVPSQPGEVRLDTMRETARAATTYDNLFSLRSLKYPAGVQEAGHYLQIAGSKTATPAVRAGCSLLAIRRATAGLHEDPNSADGYRMLGLAHLLLEQFESTLMKEIGVRWFAATRYFQAVAAFQQAAVLRPDELMIQYDLLSLNERTQRRELALEAIHQIKRLRPAPVTAEERQQWEPLINEEFALVEAMDRISGIVTQELEKGTDRFQVAAGAYQAGAVRTAIRILEEEAIYKEQNPVAKNSLAAWLMEAGRIQDGLDTFEAVEQSSTLGGIPGWRDSVATGVLVNGDYLHAIRLWNEQLQEDSSNGITATLMTLPFQGMNPMSDQYPVTHVAAVSDLIGRSRAAATSLLFKIGMAQLELGDTAAASITLRKILDREPQTQLRPIVKFYLECLTGTQIDLPAETPPATMEEFELLGDPPANEAPQAPPGKPQDPKPQDAK